MESIDDPEKFECSEAVEKSSKSGIFSNKRLLVVRKGFLYYFSNVPSEYKGHVNGVLDTLKELPKYSIDIGRIHALKLESAKSSNLVVQVKERDLIAREEIRKSIEGKRDSLSPSSTSNSDIEEWKFAFSTVLRCRLWYSCLVKLRHHFLKQVHDVNNLLEMFDPGRKSLPMGNAALIQEKQRNYTEQLSLQSINEDIKAEDAPSEHNEINSNKEQYSSESKADNKKITEENLEKISYSSPINLELFERSEKNKVEEEKQKEIKEEIKITNEEMFIIKNNKKEVEIINKFETKNEEKYIEPLKKPLIIQAMNEDIQKEEKIETIKIVKNVEKIIEPEASHERLLRQEYLRIREELIHKEEIIKKLQDQIESKPSSISILPKIEVNFEEEKIGIKKEYSIQTDEESYLVSPIRASSNEILSERNSLSLFRNSFVHRNLTSDISSEHFGAHYDYYSELARLYEPDLSFSTRLEREVILIQYCQKMEERAIAAAKSHIDTYHPCSPTTVHNGLLELKIHCEPGTILYTEKSCLVYSGSGHRELKRLFKVYNKINNEIIKQLRKNNKYPIRVPLCCLIEYKGYTIFVSQVPPFLPTDFNKITRFLKPLFDLSLIKQFNIGILENRKLPVYLLKCNQSYKISKEDFSFNKEISPWFFYLKRENEISITKDSLKEEHSVENKLFIRCILLCRELKKLMRCTIPFDGEEEEESKDFFAKFMANSKEILRLLDAEEYEGIQNTGLFMEVARILLGLKEYLPIKSVFEPISRMLDLSTLEVRAVSSSLDSYIEKEELNSAEEAFSYLKSTHSSPIFIGLKEIKLLLHYNMVEQAFDEINSLLENCNKIEALFLLEVKAECLSLLCKEEERLCLLKETLELAIALVPESDRIIELQLQIAESMALQGFIQNSIEAFKHVIQTNPQNKLITCLTLTKILAAKGVDPEILISFLKKLEPSALTEELLAELFILAHDKDRALLHYESAFEKCENNSLTHQLPSLFVNMLPLLQNINKKQLLFHKIFNKSELYTFREKIEINTALMIDSLQNKSDLERETIRKHLGKEYKNEYVKLFDIEEIEKTVSSIIKCETSEKELLANCDIGALEMSLRKMNAPVLL